jgi:hypothetical protein
MSINTCYQLFMKSPKAIALLALPEDYQKEDFAEYLDENVIYADCRQIDQGNTIYALICEALDSQKILCLDHVNDLTMKPFWEQISQLMLFMLRLEDYHTQQGILPTSQMRILLPHSDSEIDDTTLDVNLLEWACRSSMMFQK